MTGSDTRLLLNLLGEVACLTVSLSQKKQALLNGLAELIRADGWTWSLTTSENGSTVYLDAISGGDLRVIPRRGAMERAGARTESRFSKNKNSRPLPFRTLSFSDDPKRPRFTLSFSQFAEGQLSRIVFGRRPDCRPFSAREQLILKIVAEEITWLHTICPAVKSEGAAFKLTPRQLATLDLLAEGCTYKMISERLQVSSHTVHDYIKQIYRYFQTNSRASLLKQLGLRGR